jgi:beta-galactosidase
VDLTDQMRRDDYGHAVALGPLMRPGDNEVVIIARSKGQDALDRLNAVGIGGRNVAWVQTVTPAGPWKRRAFNGYAQVLVQSTGPAGLVTLTASGRGLREAKLNLRTLAPP